MRNKKDPVPLVPSRRRRVRTSGRNKVTKRTHFQKETTAVVGQFSPRIDVMSSLGKA